MSAAGKNVLVAEFPKNAQETLRIELTEYNGYNLLAMRIWTPGTDGAWVATKKGLTVRRDLIRPIIDALERAGRMDGQVDGKKAP